MYSKNASTKFLLVPLFIGLLSCHNYYKAVSLTQQDNPRLGLKLDSLNTPNKYLILRNGSAAAYGISTLKTNSADNTATLVLTNVAADHRVHLSNNGDRRYRKLEASQRGVVNEVHVYMPFDPNAKTGTYSLPLGNVEKIEALKHDAKRSTNSHLLGAGLIVGGVAIALVVAFVALAINSGH